MIPSFMHERLWEALLDLLCFATYNLVRMGSLGGWWDAHHA